MLDDLLIDISGKIDDLYDLYDLAHVAGWESCRLHDPAHISLVGYVLCATSHDGG